MKGSFFTNRRVCPYLVRSVLYAIPNWVRAAGLIGGSARAKVEMMGKPNAIHNRVTVGGFEVTSLLAGSHPVEEPHSIFGTNVSDEEFLAVSKANFLPIDVAQFYFTPTLVNTGSELVLFDTGANGAGITAALASAGYTPDQIDVVVITHMHGDHIGGLMTDGAPIFVNARYITGSIEHNHWAAAGNDGFDNNVRPLSDQMIFLKDGGAVVSGITSVAAHGHTLGHMGYMLESDGAQLMLTADTANHFVYSLAYPDWEVRFDMDKSAAAASRRKIFGMLAADKIPFIGYHLPFPATGYVAVNGDGFRYVPASYQLLV